jgi:DNA repair protein RadC
VRDLADDELLARVIGHGVAGRSAGAIAKALLADLGGLHSLARTPAGLIRRAPGLGAVQAGRIIAAIELGRRTLQTAPDEKRPMHSPKDLAGLLLPRFGAHPVERLGAVLLDARHRLMRIHVVSEGTVDRTIGTPRDILREATIAGASALVVFHNHPSGDVTPSRTDVVMARRVASAGRILGIDVLDHLILANSTYCSMKAAKLF